MRPLSVYAALITLAGAFSAPRSSYAQDPPITWGEIPKADLEMQSYPPDTIAEALVLCDYGESSVNNDLGVTFSRHLRVKIFKPKGYDWGTRVISLYTEGHAQKLDDLEGVTYSLAPDGKIVETELDDASVFEEKVDESRTRYRFTMPALTPGCVFEIRYKIIEDHPYRMQPWVFQTSIPALWSEYRAIAPHRFGYAMVTRGYMPFSVNEQTEITRSFMGQAVSYLGMNIVACTQYRWVMRDVPALREEPYVKSMRDYAASVQIQLAEFVLAAGGREKVLHSWEDLVDNLVKSKELGGRMDPSGGVRRTAETVTAGCTTPLQKMTALYDFVRSTIVWDGRERMFPVASHGDVLGAKKGSSAEIAFLLLALLRSVDIEANPAVLSTRSNGEITDVFPLANQFDYVIARATTGGTTYNLDATDPLRTVDLLPPRVLNVRALVIKPGPLEWVRLTTSKGSVRHASAKLTVSESGEVQGTFRSVDEEYGALARRRSLQEKKPLDVAKEDFDADKTTFTLDSVTVMGEDSTQVPLVITANATSGTYAQVAGDHIYINPAVIDRMTSNPFTRKERRFPVDMSYPRNITNVSAFRIPEGYAAKELPREMNVDLGLGSGFYNRRVSAKGNEIEVESRFVIQRTEFPPNLYSTLKGFYDRVAAAEAEQIVLERKPPPAPPAPPVPAPQKKKRGK